MHITTTVHLTTERLAFHDGNVDDALEDILDTFDARGDEPPRMVFEERENAWRREYARPSARARHSTFEAYCKWSYDQGAPDAKTGRWGYWTDANAQWD